MGFAQARLIGSTRLRQEERGIVVFRELQRNRDCAGIGLNRNNLLDNIRGYQSSWVSVLMTECHKLNFFDLVKLSHKR